MVRRPRHVGRLQERFLALLLLAMLCPPSPAAGVDVTDDRGKPIRLAAPARRVVTLAPDLAELVALIGASAALVGVARGSDYPSAVARLPSVGDASGIDVERVLALRPDLILAWGSGNRSSDVGRLEQLGFPVFVSETRALTAIPELMRKIGRLTDAADEAEKLAAGYESRLAALSHQPATAGTRVFIEIWDAPLMTVSGAHLISDLVARCGGTNVFADLPVLAGSVSLEAVLARDPDLIVAVLPASRHAGALWSRWPQLRAMRAGAIRQIDPDLLSRATPRILNGMERVCGWVVQDGRRKRQLKAARTGPDTGPDRLASRLESLPPAPRSSPVRAPDPPPEPVPAASARSVSDES